MAERIIILSDGTGNAASSVWRTNVWRVFQSLDLRADTQAAKYDDGVGTSSFVPLALLGGAFGWGLKRNVLDAYKFICRNYRSDSKLYLFGFSRGAFTARVITGFVLSQGLVKAETEAELHDLARKAYRAYRAGGYHSLWRIEIPFRHLRDAFVRIWDVLRRRKRYDKANNTYVPSIEFLGLWDTVAAYGLPMDEMTRGVSDWIWPLHFPDRVLNERVRYARHAIALDDERTTFHPVLWTEENEPAPPQAPYSIDNERIVQVWFAGMHANVGGGYPDDALAFVPLYWLVEEARKRGLEFKSAPDAEPDTTKFIASSQDKDGRMYNSRSGLGGYYRYGPRKVFDLCNDPDAGVKIDIPKIHHSVFGRIDSGANSYGPIGLPEKYVVVHDDGTVTPPQFEAPQEVVNRHTAQERLWNYVWMRRGVYFLTLAATFYLVLFPFIHDRNAEHEFESPIRLVSEFIRLVGSFIPESLQWWPSWYAGNPELFSIGVLALTALLLLGGRLQASIKDSMRRIWASHGSISPVSASAIQHAIYRFRTWSVYRWIIRTGRLRVLPFLFAACGAVAVLGFASHFLFNVADAMGAVCKGTEESKLVQINLGIPQAALPFDTKSLCAPTGLKVREGYRYEIVLTVDKPWSDDDVATSPIGYTSASQPFRWYLPAILPLRRILFRRWYMAVARIGETGVDEYFLEPVPVRDPTIDAYRSAFIARRSGEVFLYVNDAVIAVPGLISAFYKKNAGTARVTINLANRP
ncbi:DUF2235 domain-containing protein [Bradyrhizobium sp. LHD-71]|uniref:DUF2235 domain-containing protein n=1 Tax=Bradyrhizobium sp. LHD-71 TaxID=3072141 RepID=UPI00280F320D|nr:DUF2235 domain-containing protein [Bradyrhizobium sp. LHD-71]MDQ8732182.1 DUF2235 domain-containing protein [Bradyrhizobium sp. LHD-71]